LAPEISIFKTTISFVNTQILLEERFLLENMILIAICSNRGQCDEKNFFDEF